MNEQRPLPMRTAWPAVGRCVAASAMLLARRRVHLPRGRVGVRMRFADGTSSRVYRETVVDRPPAAEPCVLVVEFRLRLVRGLGHALFRWESLLNTPLFVGFPGLVSKLWMAHDDNGVYRGLYQWDGAAAAQAYARALWRVLALVSEPDSIGYRVLPGLRRDDLLADPRVLAQRAPDEAAQWWRPVEVIAADLRGVGGPSVSSAELGSEESCPRCRPPGGRRRRRGGSDTSSRRGSTAYCSG